MEKVGKKLLPPTGKNWCITRNHIYSLSNLGNGVCQMTFLTTLDIYGVKNSLFRYLWMLKSPIFSAYLVLCCFPDFEKLTKLLVFCPLFPIFGKTIICLHFLKHYFLSNHTTNWCQTNFVLSQRVSFNVISLFCSN